MGELLLFFYAGHVVKLIDFIAMITVTRSFDAVERARQGDQDAFSWLFQKHQSRMAVFIRYQMSEGLRLRYDIDDVLQELFLRAFRDLPHFEYRGPGSFLRWLFRIARHTLQDLARYEDRQKRQEDPTMRVQSLDSIGEIRGACRQTPSKILFQRERMAQLLKDLDALAEEDREIILLAKLEGVTTAEMAQHLGMENAQVRLRLHRALQRLHRIREVS